MDNSRPFATSLTDDHITTINLVNSILAFSLCWIATECFFSWSGLTDNSYCTMLDCTIYCKIWMPFSESYRSFKNLIIHWMIKSPFLVSLTGDPLRDLTDCCNALVLLSLGYVLAEWHWQQDIFSKRGNGVRQIATNGTGLGELWGKLTCSPRRSIWVDFLARVADTGRVSVLPSKTVTHVVANQTRLRIWDGNCDTFHVNFPYVAQTSADSTWGL